MLTVTKANRTIRVFWAGRDLEPPIESLVMKLSTETRPMCHNLSNFRVKGLFLVISEVTTSPQPNLATQTSHIRWRQRVGVGAEALVGCPSVSRLPTPSVIRRRWRADSHIQEDVTFPELRPKGGTSCCESGSWDTEWRGGGRDTAPPRPQRPTESKPRLPGWVMGGDEDTHYRGHTLHRLSDTLAATLSFFWVGALGHFEEKKERRKKECTSRHLQASAELISA